MRLAAVGCASYRTRRAALAAGICCSVLAQPGLASQQASATEDTTLATEMSPPTDEAWWTGPMLANTPATPPQGGINGETFFFEQIGSKSRLYGSLALISYGVTDRLALEVKPMFGMTRVGGNTSKPGVGDLNLMAHYRLTSPAASPFEPTVAILIQQSLPLGRYDRLDTKPSPALGSGAASTTLSLYAQQAFRLPNRRLFRARINISKTFAGSADLHGESVYGTSAGFRGRAHPGDSTNIIIAGEYSVTRRWVLALDALYERSSAGSVSGIYEPGRSATPGAANFRIDRSEAFGVALAIEYNLNPNLGLRFGTRFKFRGRNAAPSITPAVALIFSLEP